MKEIAKNLNQRGLLMRGKLWRVQKVFEVLSSPTYMGLHVFNKRTANAPDQRRGRMVRFLFPPSLIWLSLNKLPNCAGRSRPSVAFLAVKPRLIF